MSTESAANDRQNGEPGGLGDGIGISELERQIADRMSQLAEAAQEYYKLQVMLDTIDGRARLPVPEFLEPLLPEPEPVDEELQQQARRRLEARAQRLWPVRRMRPRPRGR